MAEKKKLAPPLQSPATKRMAIAVAVFFVTAMISRGGDLPVWEEQVFNFIHGWPDLFGWYLAPVTHLGSFIVLLALAGIYLARRKYHITLRLLLAGSMAYLIAGVAKDLLGRPRPIELLADVTVREFYVRGPGFPSGHAALATAIAVTLWPHLPREYRWLVPLIIVSVGLSRIYLGVHAPVDVLGGIALGWAAAELFRHVEIRMRYQKTTKKRKRVA